MTPAGEEPSITTSQPTSPSPGSKTSFSRADIIDLGNKGRPWEFLPIAAKALEIAPNDTGLVILTVANLMACGLGTLASEVLTTLPDHIRSQENVVRLEGAIRRLADDRILGAQRVGAAVVNLEALREHHAEAASRCDEAWGAWESSIDQTEWFRALDGNVIRRSAGARGLRGCLSLTDQRGQARAFAAQVAPTTELMGRPLVVEGMSPPWVFTELMRSSEQGLNGYQRRVVVVQADAAELLDGLSHGDVRELLTQPRVEMHVGADAASSLARAMASRMGTVLVGRYIPVFATRTKAAPPVEQVLVALEREQQAEHHALMESVQEKYRGKTRGWWRDRYASGEPLRVLIPTCRFSTFVRSSSEDLAAAFEAAGHRARVVMEPDAHSSLSSVGYLREINEFEPDLVVLINYPRASMGPFFPANVPYVCWVQDAMPHLFDNRLGAAQGDLDYMVGVRLTELVNRFGYSRRRCMPMPVVVSERKFSAPAARARLQQSVEIVYATHHGETPAAMHQRLMKEASKDPVLPRAMEMLQPLAKEIARDILAVGIKQRIKAGIVSVVSGLTGASPPERVISVLTHAYVIPMADRILRHEAAAWAASIATRRGWTLKLCGKNWDAHPTLGAFAAPAIEHGGALRESYAGATVHLHASYHGPFHQRVFECVLAGGLPLCRLVWPTVSPLLGHARTALRRQMGPALVELAPPGGATARCGVDEHPELADVADYFASLGLPGLPGWRRGDLCEVPVEPPSVVDTEEHTAELVRPVAALSFRDEAELERLIERASSEPAWREHSSGQIAAGVRRNLTHEVLCGRMIEMVRSDLAGAPAAAETTAQRPTLSQP